MIAGVFAVVVMRDCVVVLWVVVVVVDIVVGAGVLVVDGKLRSPSQLSVRTAFELSINLEYILCFNDIHVLQTVF